MNHVVPSALGTAWAPILLQSDDGDGGGGLFGDGATQIFLVLGGVLLMFLIVRSTARRFASRNREHVLEKIDADAQREERRQESRKRPSGRTRGNPEVERLFVELQDFTREVEGRLDTKILYLKGLIGDADRAATRLERLTARAADVSLPGAEVAGASAGEVPSGEAETPEPAHADPDDAEEQVGSRIDVTVGETTADTGEASSRVLELHAAGKSPQTISETVGLPKGEVELMINLHESQGQPKTS